MNKWAVCVVLVRDNGEVVVVRCYSSESAVSAR